MIIYIVSSTLWFFKEKFKTLFIKNYTGVIMFYHACERIEMYIIKQKDYHIETKISNNASVGKP